MRTKQRDAKTDLENAIATGQVTGGSIEQAAAWLRNEDYGAIEATKALRSVFQMSLAAAKDVIMTNPAWEVVARESRSVQSAALEALRASDGAFEADDDDDGSG